MAVTQEGVHFARATLPEHFQPKGHQILFYVYGQSWQEMKRVSIHLRSVRGLKELVDRGDRPVAARDLSLTPDLDKL